ncbi:hypothetical protein Z043_110742 [Scleropages formosus]|uniref:Uncharacterized protein n=1 Tax=Scleropages formosus TaxID=113540 RepID=A0A0P7X7T4_SCLFO|nr:hypothetical protein Z043_110742 [Scleropages formosus]
MIVRPNSSVSSILGGTQGPEEVSRSECVLGFIPVIYYSALLCVGVPGTSQIAGVTAVEEQDL